MLIIIATSVALLLGEYDVNGEKLSEELPRLNN